MKITITLLLLLFILQSIHAQYLGGNGRGDAFSVKTSQALTGEDLTYAYHSGGGRGDILVNIFGLALTGEHLTVLYAGSEGRGDAFTEISSGFADCAVVSYWNGSISEDWQNPVNWNCNAVPGINSNVIIPPGVPRFPRILTTTEIKSLTLSAGTTVNVNPGVQLKVNGN